MAKRKPKPTLVDQAINKGRKKAVQKSVNEGPTKENTKEKFSVTEVKDVTTIISVGKSVTTVTEALAKAEIDLNLWEISSQEVNSWEVAGKLNPGQDESGRWKGEKLWKQPLWQVKVKLQRRAPKPIQEGIKGLLADFRKKPPTLPRVPRRAANSPYLLELSLVDAHFGKRCWGAETGEQDYDLDIAEGDYLAAVEDLLNKIQGYKVGKILLPLGNDFFQANNWISETAHGTRVDSVDDRFQKVFRVGCRAIHHALMKCREIAPVERIWIPGNHDPETSWYMCEWLDARFNGDKHVTFDNGARARKYRDWGITLLGYTHLYHEKMKDLPLVMAQEARQLWASTVYRAWRCGHFHKKAETSFVAGDTFNDTRVDILPSLSGTDKWHYEQGYVQGLRTAETYLWGKEEGYVGHFSTMARSQQAALAKKKAA